MTKRKEIKKTRAKLLSAYDRFETEEKRNEVNIFDHIENGINMLMNLIKGKEDQLNRTFSKEEANDFLKRFK